MAAPRYGDRMGPTRGRYPLGEDGLPFDMGRPGWRPPPPDGWPLRNDEWGPPPPGGWAPLPGEWGPRGQPHPDWGPRGAPDWRPHLDDWPRPPGEWRPPHPEDWRPPHPEAWRADRPLPPPGWGHPGWGREVPRDPWGPEPVPPGPVPPIPPSVVPHPPVAAAPPDPATYGAVAPAPQYGFPGFPPPAWTGEPVAEQQMLNPPPDQPQWIKALISAPPAESTPEANKSTEEPAALDSAPLTKPEPVRTKVPGLLGKRTFDKPPPGRSTGIISFIGPTFGYIEREDLEKFTFSFAAFFGNPKALRPGVRVHFTGCKEKKNVIATDVKVAPGGTENVDAEIYEAVVSQPIVEPQPGERQFPGQVHVTIGPLRTNLTFTRKDSTVTLLKNDQVLINLLNDIVTEKRRATNIRPKIPATFSSTGETRLKGVILSLKDERGVISNEEHGELPFDIKENFSDVEFTYEDVSEEVEFTSITLSSGKRAVRIRRLKEPLLLTLSQEPEAEHGEAWSALRGRATAELAPNMKLDTELYEGIVSQPIIEPTPNMPGYPGQIHANIGPVRTNVTFDHRDCRVTLLKNDHVLINLLLDVLSRKRRAANIRPKIPFTFSYTKEKRELGTISVLGPEHGVVRSEEHGELPFHVCENFSDTEFNCNDVHTQVEFTTAQMKSEKRAIRLRRLKRGEDKILEEQKRREEEEKKKKKVEEETRTKQEEEERKSREEEEQQQRETDRRKKEEAAAALAAARNKWTPLGFKMTDPYTKDDISKERFQGTVLRAVHKNPRKELKKEPRGAAGAEQEPEEAQDKMKVEKMDGGVKKEEEEGKPAEGGEREVKREEEEEEEATGRLVMTIDGQQKQLPFSVRDLLTTATMLDGDKVRFNIATHQETRSERAAYVEILPDSFEESTEQRRHGIIIEFSGNSGLIKCSQNPQLFFLMSEVIEKKKLELNEKVDFSVVPHETAEGGTQAIRIKRFTESVFLPVRKLVGVGTSKGKMTIKLSKTEETQKENPESDRLKAVVKSLRTQDNRSSSSRRDHGAERRRHVRSRSKSRSRSPARDQFGRIVKRKRSTSTERDRRSDRHRPGRERMRRSKSRSKSRSRSRSRDRARSSRKRTSRQRDDAHRRRREPSPPPPPRRGVVDDELARKKRELEELNEMIAYRKSLVDPQALDPAQRTCIDYDHGRISVPLAEYKPVRSILKKRPDGPEFPPAQYEDPYYDGSYGSYLERRYTQPYATRAYSDRPYGDRPNAEHPSYESGLYSEPPPSSQRFTDRYDVYDEAYDDRHYDPGYTERPYNDLYHPVTLSKPPEHPSSQSAGSSHSYHPLPTSSSSQPTYRPPTPIAIPPRSLSPKLENTPPVERPPLDRFLDMLSKKVVAEKKSEQVHLHDDLLPHERALQDGGGFSRIVGLAQERPSSSRTLEAETKETSPAPSPVQIKTENQKIKTEPYDKIQSLLRTIGLKLSTGDVSKLANRAQEKILYQKSSSTERDTFSSPKEEQRSYRKGSVESDYLHSSSPIRSSSLEPPGLRVSEYEEFLDQQELETLKKAQQLQSLTKTIGSTLSTTSPGPPPAQYQHPPTNWPLGGAFPAAQTSTATNMETQPSHRFGFPPGPPPGPPSQYPGQPPPGPPPQRHYAPPSGHSGYPLIGRPPAVQSPDSSLPQTSETLSPGHPDQSAISTTVARCLKVIETVKSLAAQPPSRPVKSVQFSLPTESPSTSCQTETEEDIKAKQQEKLDLYNQRIQEKREQQFQEMVVRKKLGERNKDGSLLFPVKPVEVEPRNVWICGHSLVYWAESRAKSPEVGMQLGMDLSKVALWWKGTQGMTWSQLLPQLHQLKVTWPNPDVLIVHLGGNDLSTDSPTDLLASVRKDLTSMRSIFPRCLLVWSNILPRRVWRHSADSHEVDLVRTTVNRRIQNIVSELGGTSLTHDNIRCGANTGLYRADGVHLSPKGIDIFNLNIQDFLEKWEVEMNKALD